MQRALGSSQNLSYLALGVSLIVVVVTIGLIAKR
jgi:hypothetical protein